MTELFDLQWPMYNFLNEDRNNFVYNFLRNSFNPISVCACVCVGGGGGGGGGGGRFDASFQWGKNPTLIGLII